MKKYRISIDLTVEEMIDFCFYMLGQQKEFKNKRCHNYRTVTRLIAECKKHNDNMALEEAYWANPDGQNNTDYIRRFVLGNYEDFEK